MYSCLFVAIFSTVQLRSSDRRHRDLFFLQTPDLKLHVPLVGAMQVSSVLGGAGFTIGIVQVLGVNTLKLKKNC